MDSTRGRHQEVTCLLGIGAGWHKFGASFPDMSQPPTAPLSEARPVDTRERFALLDVLRGFALCGVFVSNVHMWFSGRAFIPRARMEAAMNSASWLDTAATHGTGALVAGKFITLF